MSINLFIPAAGYGTRLRPLTNAYPKPLLPIAGIPLIQRIIESIASQLELNRIGVNTHYLPQVVQEWSENTHFKEKIDLFHEEEILGTGGALVNAKKLFSTGPCLLANGDVINGVDWQKLWNFHKESGNMVTLAVQDREHERRVGADKDGSLLCIDQSCSTPGVNHWFGYACAAIYEPEFLDFLPEGESHVVPFWVEASQKTGRVKVFDIGRQTYWLDIGNPQSYTQAVVDALKGENRYFDSPLSTPVFTELNGQVVIEKDVHLGDYITLENTIVLPGSKVPDQSDIKNCIVVGEERVDVVWPLLSESLPKLNKIGNGGSDRIYQRENGKVKLIYSAFEQNIERQLTITEQLRQKNVNVPEIHSINRFKREVILKDLGDTTFRFWLAGKNQAQIDSMLQTILDELEKFQFSEVDVSDKIFDYEVLRWETSYFLERFVQRLCAIDRDLSSLKDEFHKLAEAVDSLPKAVMHRDFQSENIMIYQDQPWFIDFQTAHFGPPFFDLVSLLADPYISLPPELVEKYKSTYLSSLGQKLSMNEEQCERAYILCGLQRHMQALGAYGFLSKIRGKEEFLEHVSSAFSHLEVEATSLKDEFPVLCELLKEVKEKI